MAAVTSASNWGATQESPPRNKSQDNLSEVPQRIIEKYRPHYLASAKTQDVVAKIQEIYKAVGIIDQNLRKVFKSLAFRLDANFKEFTDLLRATAQDIGTQTGALDTLRFQILTEDTVAQKIRQDIRALDVELFIKRSKCMAVMMPILLSQYYPATFEWYKQVVSKCRELASENPGNSRLEHLEAFCQTSLTTKFFELNTEYATRPDGPLRELKGLQIDAVRLATQVAKMLEAKPFPANEKLTIQKSAASNTRLTAVFALLEERLQSCHEKIQEFVNSISPELSKTLGADALAQSTTPPNSGALPEMDLSRVSDSELSAEGYWLSVGTKINTGYWIGGYYKEAWKSSIEIHGLAAQTLGLRKELETTLKDLCSSVLEGKKTAAVHFAEKKTLFRTKLQSFETKLRIIIENLIEKDHDDLCVLVINYGDALSATFVELHRSLELLYEFTTDEGVKFIEAELELLQHFAANSALSFYLVADKHAQLPKIENPTSVIETPKDFVRLFQSNSSKWIRELLAARATAVLTISQEDTITMWNILMNLEPLSTEMFSAHLCSFFVKRATELVYVSKAAYDPLLTILHYRLQTTYLDQWNKAKTATSALAALETIYKKYVSDKQLADTYLLNFLTAFQTIHQAALSRNIELYAQGLHLFLDVSTHHAKCDPKQQGQFADILKLVDEKLRMAADIHKYPLVNPDEGICFTPTLRLFPLKLFAEDITILNSTPDRIQGLFFRALCTSVYGHKDNPELPSAAKLIALFFQSPIFRSFFGAYTGDFLRLIYRNGILKLKQGVELLPNEIELMSEGLHKT